MCDEEIETLSNNNNIYNAKYQLWICLSHSVNLVYCDATWSEVTDCGTFIEVHKPLD